MKHFDFIDECAKEIEKEDKTQKEQIDIKKTLPIFRF